MRIYNIYLIYKNYLIIFMPHKTSQAGKIASLGIGDTGMEYGGRGKSEKGKGKKEKGKKRERKGKGYS